MDIAHFLCVTLKTNVELQAVYVYNTLPESPAKPDPVFFFHLLVCD